jgi:hypothetical protein
LRGEIVNADIPFHLRRCDSPENGPGGRSMQLSRPAA